MILPKVIATDLDGTFLSPDGTISDLNRVAVRRAFDAGILVVFATGRPPTWLSDICDLGLAHSVVVACNGAVLFDGGTRQILEAWPLDARVCLEVGAQMREVMPGITFGIQQAFAFGHEPDYFSIAPDSVRGQWFTGSLEDLVDAGPFVKMLAHHPRLTAHEMAERAARIVGSQVTITHSMASDYGLLEVSAAGVTKAQALDVVIDKMGITSDEVAAFGDMPNDRDMLQWAGRAYLMANAHPSMADLPAVRIGSNADSAVGREILSWLD